MSAGQSLQFVNIVSEGSVFSGCAALAAAFPVSGLQQAPINNRKWTQDGLNFRQSNLHVSFCINFPAWAWPHARVEVVLETAARLQHRPVCPVSCLQSQRTSPQSIEVVYSVFVCPPSLAHVCLRKYFNTCCRGL